MEIYFYNSDEFLKQLQDLEIEYNQIAYFYKYIDCKAELDHQMQYLKDNNIMCFSGFISSKIIKITIKDKSNKKYCIEYKFKWIKGLYKPMYNFLRMNERQKK